jgi:hypothetical protein
MVCVRVAPRDGRDTSHARAARITVVRKNGPWSYKNIIFNMNSPPDQHVIFDGDPIPNVRSGFDENMVTEVAFHAYVDVLHHMDIGPDTRPSSNIMTVTQCCRMSIHRVW